MQAPIESLQHSSLTLRDTRACESHSVEDTQRKSTHSRICALKLAREQCMDHLRFRTTRRARISKPRFTQA